MAPGSVVFLIVPLVLWRIYVRVRRLVARQRFSKVRSWITLAVFPALVLVLAYVVLGQPDVLAWLAAGLTAGALLGLYGLKRTRFEATPQGLFYTPNARLGIAVSLLFLGKFAYRLFELYTMPLGATPVANGSTLAIFGVLAGYYVSYAAGLVRKTKSGWNNPRAG